MKKLVVLTMILTFVLCSCSPNKFHSNYVLKRNFLHRDLPNIKISIINDTCATLVKKGTINDSLFFEFYKHKYSLIITSVSDSTNIFSLNKNDTLLHFKNDIVLGKNKIMIFGREDVTYNLSKKKFIYESKRRRLELKFVNDSICTLTNTFNCPSIEPKYKVIVQKCLYTRIDNDIYLENKDSMFGNSSYIEIPPQNSNVCYFLNENNRRTKQIYIGPNYATGYEKYGIIPNITNDTLRIVNNEIIFPKKYADSRVIFVLRR